jgi:ferredoxin-type protein NapH
MSEIAMTKSGSATRLRVLRRGMQLLGAAVLGQWSLYGVLRCPFVVPYVSCQNCPIITCHGRLVSMFWGFWLLLPLSAIVVGRAFCGWACPGGLAVQLLGKLAPFGRKYAKGVSRLAPYGKYLAVALCLYALFPMGQPRADVPIRVGAFFESVRLTFEHADMLWLVRSAVVLGFLALGVLLAGAWCRFACPTGGALELVKGVSFLKVFKTTACNGCGKCTRVCEMATRPEEANCTNCGDCLDSCPEGAIGFGRTPRGQ